MDTETVLVLLSYSYWATEIILDAASQVSSVQFISSVAPNPGHGSLRGTLVHMLDTEISWRQILQELELSPDLVEKDFPDVSTLKNRWAVEHENWFSFCRSLSTRTICSPDMAFHPAILTSTITCISNQVSPPDRRASKARRR